MQAILPDIVDLMARKLRQISGFPRSRQSRLKADLSKYLLKPQALPQYLLNNVPDDSIARSVHDKLDVYPHKPLLLLRGCVPPVLQTSDECICPSDTRRPFCSILATIAVSPPRPASPVPKAFAGDFLQSLPTVFPSAASCAQRCSPQINLYHIATPLPTSRIYPAI